MSVIAKLLTGDIPKLLAWVNLILLCVSVFQWVRCKIRVRRATNILQILNDFNSAGQIDYAVYSELWDGINEICSSKKSKKMRGGSNG